MKKILLFVLALACLITCVPVTQVSAAGFQYDADAAVAFADANWDSGVGDCGTFVSDCLHAGGMKVRSGGADLLRQALLDIGAATGSQLKLDANGKYVNKADNPQLKKGDIAFFYCSKCAREYHVVIIGGFDENGNAYYYGHIPGHYKHTNFKVLEHTTADGTVHENCISFSAVHMDLSVQDHQHDFRQNLLSKEHPHTVYDQCYCGAKYSLGWDGGSLSACKVCNPAFVESPASGAAPVATAIAHASGKPCIRWTPMEGAARYEVFRARTGTDAYIRVYSTVYTVFTDTEVPADRAHDYRVRAVMEDGSYSAYSNVLYFACSTEPAPPGNLTPSPLAPDVVPAPVLTAKEHESGKPSLKWNMVAEASGYEIYQAVSGSGNFTLVATTPYYSYTHLSALVGADYDYKVRAVLAAGGYTDYSNVITFRQEDTSPAPVIAAKAHTSGKPSMKWDKLAGASEYEIYRAVSGTGAFALIYTTTYGSFTNTGALDTVSYDYKIRAVWSAGGYSDFSNVLTFAATEAAPIAPVLAAKAHTSGKPSMKWDKLDGASKYEIYRAVSGTDAFALIYTTTYGSFTNTGALDTVSYDYKIRAVWSAGGYSDFSNVVSFPAEEAAPAAPVLTAKTHTSGKPSMKWDKLPGATYEIYRAVSGTGNFSLIYTTTWGSFTNTGAASGVSYDYKLRAILPDGAYTEFSNILTVTSG